MFTDKRRYKYSRFNTPIGKGKKEEKPDKKPRIIHLYNQGASIFVIQKTLNVSEAIIFNTLKKAGLLDLKSSAAVGEAVVAEVGEENSSEA